MTYYNLMARVWGPEYLNDIQILRTWISRLRQKIEADPGKPGDNHDGTENRLYF